MQILLIMNNKMLAHNLRKVLTTTGIIDYSFLGSNEALAVFPVVLDELLLEAKRTFENILDIPESKLDFKNTVEAYVNQDKELHLLFAFLNNFNATDSSDTTRKIINDFQPKITEYINTVSMHPTYYQRIKAVYAKEKNADTEQQKCMELIIRDMEFAGVHLQGKKKARLEEINQQLALLSEKFTNNVLDDKKRFFYHFANDESLKEMPQEDMDSASEEAKRRKLKGFVFTLSPPSIQAILKFCPDANIRKKFWLKNSTVASKGKFDNRPVILDILRLKEEKAKLLGKKNFADYVLQQRMAKNKAEVLDTLDYFATKSLPKATQELSELKKFSEKKDLKLWDIAYYSEKLLKEKYQVDEKVTRPYFALEATLKGLFQIVEKLFGITLKEIKLDSYAPDVRTFEVFLGKDKIAYFIFDAFARPQKQGGAWCNELRSRWRTEGILELPIVINVMNCSKSTQPLLTHRDVETLFHEFGHALHLILGHNSYTNLSGFHTEWDFVELPSQLLENWTWEAKSLGLFAKHNKTGKPMPNALLASLKKSRIFMKGLFMLRQNEFGFLDFLLHSESVPKNKQELEEKCLRIANMYSIMKKPKTYKMFASFSHIFSGGYAAGYYSYLWAEILEADVFERFRNEGILNPKLGAEYRDKIIAPGATKSGYELFTSFVGRKPRPDALLKKMGII